MKLQRGVAKTATSSGGLAYPFYGDTSEEDYMSNINFGLIPKITLGGNVWNDDSDGTKETGEDGIEGVAVTISKVIVSRSNNIDTIVAILDEEYYTTTTDSSGNWSAKLLYPSLTYTEANTYASALGSAYKSTKLKYAIWQDNYRVAYNVTFTYDGQTYQSTEYLIASSSSVTSGSASAFVGYTSNKNRTYWANSSFAQESSDDRTEFDSKFAIIQGDEELDTTTLTTIGEAIGTDGTTTQLEYTFDSNVSTLVSSNSDGTLTDYQMSISTGTGGILYPCDNSSYAYSYLSNINLGLVTRDEVDIEVEKKLSQAIVVVNGKAMTYDFSGETSYTLNLYDSDYCYRVEDYDTDILTALNNYYEGLGYDTAADALEMQVYLTFTITITNNSSAYDVKVNEIADYYSTTWKLIDTNMADSLDYATNDSTAYIEDMGISNVASDPVINYTDGTTGYVSWNIIEGSYTYPYSSTSTISFYKTTASLNSVIEAGDFVTITSSYQVKKIESRHGVTNAIQTGTKYNVAEITSYSTYYTGTDTYAGKIDKDSAPDNIISDDIANTEYYDDDTAQVKIEIKKMDIPTDSYKDRIISGLVWEDSQIAEVLYNQIIGDGIYDEDNESVIEGITVELYEVVKVGDDETAEVLIDSTTTDSGGGYSFNELPAGNFRVRFVYGNSDTTVCYNTDGTSEDKIYSGQDYKSTSYQVGIDNDSDEDGYQDGYINNEWDSSYTSDERYSDERYSDERYSDARDSEARRLVITKQSEILTYDNSSILATADDLYADHSELLGEYDNTDPVYGSGYYMYADTAKFALEIEDVTGEYGSGVVIEKDEDTDIYTTESSINANYTYEVGEVDFGLEERSETEIVLDKQIQEIIFTTADGNMILDAIYDITYSEDCFTLNDDGTTTFDQSKVEVTLDESSIGASQIASLNRTSSMQGYRYIMLESTIMQGATIEVVYQFTALNIGEADTCNQILVDLWATVNESGDMTAYEDAVEYLIDRNNNNIYGLYFGSIYYLGTAGKYLNEDTYSIYNEDGSLNANKQYWDAGIHNVLVETTVHQIIDYVDPDVEFVSIDNNVENASWTTTTIEYLLENNLIDPEAVIIIDTDGDPVFKKDDSGNFIAVATYADVTVDDDGDVVLPKRSDGYSANGESYTLLNDEIQRYISDTKNNVILSTDDDSSNSDLLSTIIPYGSIYKEVQEVYTEAIANGETEEEAKEAMSEMVEQYSTSSIALQVSRYYSSEDDSSYIDNLAEIIKIENTVGRRDTKSIVGNTITYQIDWDEVEDQNIDDDDIPTTTIPTYEIAATEPDTSATEIITLTPPTGYSTVFDIVMQILAIIGFSAVILVIGIVLIKKKVLKNKL